MKRNLSPGVTSLQRKTHLWIVSTLPLAWNCRPDFMVLLVMLPMVPSKGYHDIREAGQVDEAPCNDDTERPLKGDKKRFIPHARLRNDLKQTCFAKVQRRCALDYLT